jgi:16S rRNA (uracil1498-N3)-methyltransferase
MRRFYLPPSACRSDALTLSGAEAHHALRVLRVRVGERVIVLNGAGEELTCQVAETGRRAFTLDVLQRQRIVPMPCQITLVQAVPKGRTMDFIVQKATELGAARIVPTLSERSVPQWNPAEAATKRARWQMTAVEAIKQCGLAWLPAIDSPQDIAAITDQGALAELSLMASLHPGAQHPRARIETFLADNGRLPRSVAVWVGPEGDFSPRELEQIQRAGAKPVTLGRLVLRSETAALYCLSTLQYELQAPRSG